MFLSNLQKKITISILFIVLTAFLVGSLNSIIILWKSVYIEEGQSINEFNSVELDILSAIERSYKSILPLVDSESEVEKIYLYISEKNQKYLLSSLPDSRKEWVDGLVRDNDQFKKISVKHRGDNPNNWLHDKKSWRVKRKKSDLKDGVRVFNYSLPRDSSLINTYMGYYIAQKMNLMVPEFNFVELYINDKYEGLYLETQHIDENLLRMNLTMPVNIYKGTPSRTDKAFNQDNDLFNNPFLWEKRAVFNARDPSNYFDLKRLLTLVRSSVNSREKLDQLEQVADIKKWANFSAYETIMQSWHNYEKNNMYLISDPWLGEIYPLAYDTIFNDTRSSIEVNEPIKMDNAAHALMEVYLNNSKFLYEKYKILDELVKNNFYQDIENEANRIYSLIRESWVHDSSHVQFALTNGFDRSLIYNEGMDQEVQKFIDRITFINEQLTNNLNNYDNFSWSQINNELEFVINSYKPITKIKLCFKSNANIFGINLIEKNTTEFIGIKDKNGCYGFNVVMNSNRVKPQFDVSRITNFQASNGFEIKPTSFSFIVDKSLEIYEVYAMFLGSKEYETNNNNINLDKNTRFNNNIPINLSPIVETLIWKGDIYIDELKVIDKPVKIMPGTTIFLGEKASIIFKNQVKSLGSKSNKINFIKSSENSWGVVALIGEKTKDSIFEHTNLSGGSGGFYDGYEFTGMFSIYSSEGVNLSKVSISNNTDYDDLIHILYSSEIKFSDSTFYDARADAIDIDISDVEIENCSFINSGNDAIDSMTSKVIVTNTNIDKAGDKGVSAGESSQVYINNLTFNNTEIAVQSKDDSSVHINNSKFLNNKIQLDAYQKNWRYGNGGKIKVIDSMFKGKINQINAKNNSEIIVINNSFNNNFSHLETKKIRFDGNYLNN